MWGILGAVIISFALWFFIIVGVADTSWAMVVVGGMAGVLLCGLVGCVLVSVVEGVVYPVRMVLGWWR